MVCGIPYVVQRGMCNIACVVCCVGQYMVLVFAVRRVHALRFVFFGLCVVCGVLYGVWCSAWYVLCVMCCMCCVVCVIWCQLCVALFVSCTKWCVVCNVW